MHILAASKCTNADESRWSCAVCYTLIANGASFTEVNGLGKTPPEVVLTQHETQSYYPRLGYPRKADPTRTTLNHHLIATMREIEIFQLEKHRHLGRDHFRDWTTVTHAWCTPSAQLTAVTVLLVGCSCKRLAVERNLPRLPMDCWYRILNMIPRHELRLGDCTPKDEKAASLQYNRLLLECKRAT